jgi:hypothetical protein
VTDESIVAAALAIGSPAARAALLDRACAGDPVRRREIDELLVAHAADNPLDRPPAGLARAGTYEPADDPSAASAGDRIGPCRLMEQLGEGGLPRQVVWPFWQSKSRLAGDAVGDAPTRVRPPTKSCARRPDPLRARKRMALA